MKANTLRNVLRTLAAIAAPFIMIGIALSICYDVALDRLNESFPA